MTTWVLVTDVDHLSVPSLPTVRLSGGDDYRQQRVLLFDRVLSLLTADKQDSRLVLLFALMQEAMAEAVPVDLSFACFFRRGNFPFCVRLCRGGGEESLLARIQQYYALKPLRKDVVLSRQALMQNPFDVTVLVADDSQVAEAADAIRRRVDLVEMLQRGRFFRLLNDGTFSEFQPAATVQVGPIDARLKEPRSDYRGVSREDGATTLGLCQYLQRVGRLQEAGSVAAACASQIPGLLKIRALAASAAGEADQARQLFSAYKQCVLANGLEGLNSLQLNDCASAALLERDFEAAREFALQSISRNPFASTDPYRTLLLVSESGCSSAQCEQVAFEYLVGLDNSRRAVQYYSKVCSQAQHPLKPLRLFFYSQFLVFHDTNKARKLLEQAISLLQEPYPTWASHIFSQYGHLIHSVPAYRSHRDARGPLEKALEISPNDHLCQSVYASYLLSVGEKERGLEYARRATSSDELWSRVSAFFMISCYSHDDDDDEDCHRRDLIKCVREALESQMAVPTLFLDDHVKHRSELAPLLEALKRKKKQEILQVLGQMESSTLK